MWLQQVRMPHALIKVCAHSVCLLHPNYRTAANPQESELISVSQILPRERERGRSVLTKQGLEELCHWSPETPTWEIHAQKSPGSKHRWDLHQVAPSSWSWNPPAHQHKHPDILPLPLYQSLGDDLTLGTWAVRFTSHLGILSLFFDWLPDPHIC